MKDYWCECYRDPEHGDIVECPMCTSRNRVEQQKRDWEISWDIARDISQEQARENAKINANKGENNEY